MTTLTVLGLILIISSLILLIAPKKLTEANRAIMALDEKLMKYKVGIGIIALLVGITCLFVAYTIYVKI